MCTCHDRAVQWLAIYTDALPDTDPVEKRAALAVIKTLRDVTGQSGPLQACALPHLEQQDAPCHS